MEILFSSGNWDFSVVAVKQASASVHNMSLRYLGFEIHTNGVVS